MSNIHRVASNYAHRPDDQRFESLEDLHTACKAYAMQSQEIPETTLEPIEVDGQLVFAAGMDMYKPTYGCFSKLCADNGIPADYLRKLPVGVATQALQATYTSRPRDLLVSGTALRAVTSSRYVRVWDYEVAEMLLAFRDRNLSWGFPTPFRKAGQAGQGKHVPTAFASDSDMFVFLCNYDGIEVNGTLLSRGIIVENSEVGQGALRLTRFLFDYMCSNCIIWGAQDIQDISLRHTGSVREAILQTGSLAQAAATAALGSPKDDLERISQAQRRLLGATRLEVVNTIYAKRNNLLTRKLLTEAYDVAAANERYGDPRSVWAMVNGITELSQQSAYTSQRTAIDTAASTLFSI